MILQNSYYLSILKNTAFFIKIILILKKFDPISPGSRHKIQLFFAKPKLPFKKKFSFILRKKKAGRSSQNGILLYKRVAPKFKKAYNVNSSLYLSNSLSFLSCYLPGKKTSPTKGIIKYANGGFSCINTPLGLKIGSLIKSVVSLDYAIGKFSNINLGDTVLISFLTRRSIFFNVTNPEHKKNTLARASGTYCYIVAYEKVKGYTKIQMPSGNQKYIFNFTFVTLGRNSNSARR